MGSFSPIHTPPIAAIFFSDASLEGWGGTDGVTHVGGRWTEAEMPPHINALELHAPSLTLEALGAPHTDIHIRLMLDNTTATVYINKMGGTHSLICDDIAKSIWQWATHRNIWLSAAYVPGSDNTASFSDSFIRSTLGNIGLSQGSTKLLSHAWREGTTRQYDTTVRRWGAYCRQWEIAPLAPPIAAVVNFFN